MAHIEIYIWLLAIIACVGGISGKISIPTPLLLVIVGMLLSFIPDLPKTRLDPDLVLNVFLPLLVYAGSKYTSWHEVKLNKRPIALLSIGHVLFIMLLVAIVAHSIIPGLPWAIAFVLGAVISPPDDVAIFAIAEKIYFPRRLLVVLMGESLLNDATALTLFRFALAAVITHYFSPVDAFLSFFAVVIGEITYGLIIGHAMGRLRMYIKDPVLQVIFSILTPFVAYIPAVRIGGCGVLATVVTGFIISHYYAEKYSPNVRLLAQAVWDTLSFAVQSILFLLVGLNFQSTVSSIKTIPTYQLFLLGGIITLTVIIGRFFWVYPTSYLPRFLFQSIRKKEPYPPWQFPFIISWAGMRGGVSLAAAMAIPELGLTLDGVDLRELIIFLTFCVIIATLLLQGITLPWVVKKLGLASVGQDERELERLDQLTAKLEMVKAVLHWLSETAEREETDTILQDEIRLQSLAYRAIKIRIQEAIHDQKINHITDKSQREMSSLQINTQTIQIEREVLATLWQEGRISLSTKNLLVRELDLHVFNN